MNISQFNDLVSQGYNRIPLVREVLADLETPLSVYLKLAKGPYSYFLESVQGGEKWGRYSIIGLPCSTVLKVSGNDFKLEQNGQIIEQHESADPFADIESFQQQYKIPELESLPRFNGGLVGYFAYDTVRYVEHKVADSAPVDTVGTPDIILMVSEEVIVFDNLRGTISLLVYANPDEDEAFAKADARLDALTKELHKPLDPELFRPVPQSGEVDEESFISSFGEQAYKDAVEKIKKYIIAGDVFQVVLAQRMSIPFDGDAINIYRALRQLNPSPYMVYMDFEDFHIVSASPEILARVEEGHITVRPLAGTRRRGHTEEEDLELEKELLADEKERAEHLMLIDLSRNDAGRVSKTGSVEVTRKMFVERYSHVMHIASNVESEIAKGKTALDVLKATLPVGTLSGAPKVRAMEIIDEFEPVKRGVYGGAMGYLSWNGNMDMAIAIRTAVIKDNTLYVEAGAGIVADSVPSLEWKETMNKARALFQAVKLVDEGMQ
jgi:anthranilate synthase component 1